MTDAPLVTARLRLVVLDADIVDGIAAGRPGDVPFVVPSWWPDEEGRDLLARLHARRGDFAGRDEWRVRALVDASGVMVGHAGFHLPPRPLGEALDDPTFEGTVGEPSARAVELGYTVFPTSRGTGLATEAVVALNRWAFATGEVDAIVATVLPTNEPSLAVLRRAGGFRLIGACRDEDGHEELVLVAERPTGTEPGGT